jgi:TonB family protein
MRVILLAAAFALAGAAPAPEDGEALDVNPDWIKKPDFNRVQAVMPPAALRKGLSGRAIIECVITRQGLLEACRIVSEEPEGEGFGEAALLLAPSFLLKPGMKGGKPVQSSVRIPINFKASGRVDGAYIQKVTMVSEPIWEKAPSFADMAAAWPSGAKAEFGHVSMRCGFTNDGLLENCLTISETPGGQGFGKAARTVVARHFQLRMTPEKPEISQAYVNLPIRFTNPNINPTAPRTIIEPKWITRVDPAKIIKIYPDAAVKAGVTSGRGVADCLVAPDGGLTDCRPAPATPEGLGFSEAAVQVASVMVMNPWSDGGGPVDGVRIKLPVRFNLAEEQAAPKP